MLPFESQNLNDDDGAVIDSFFLETDSPPSLKELNEPIIVKTLREPAPITRLLTMSQSFDPSWPTPVQLLPADACRKSLQVSVYSPTAILTDGIRLSDDIGTVAKAGRVLHNGTIPLDGHTGALYATTCGAAGAASATVYVEVWSVTE
jgi:hypothetical protein